MTNKAEYYTMVNPEKEVLSIHKMPKYQYRDLLPYHGAHCDIFEVLKSSR